MRYLGGFGSAGGVILPPDADTVSLLSDLKNTPIEQKEVFLIGKTAVYDGLGGFYHWDPNASGAEDTVFMNIIPSNLSATGRWIRVFQNAKNYPHGVMVLNGGVKTFYAPGVINASGEVTINLTEDNTATGNALFNEIWWQDSKALFNATDANDCISSMPKPLPVGLKTTTHKFFKGNQVTVSVGLLVKAYINAPTGTPVNFIVQGI